MACSIAHMLPYLLLFVDQILCPAMAMKCQCLLFDADTCCCHYPCRMEWGGSNIRPEATGYGAVYFGEEILKETGDSFKVCWPV